MTSYLPLTESIDYQSSPFDNAYQSPQNMRESVTRVVNSTCTKDSLQSRQFGSSTLVHLPQNRLLSNVVLVARLPANRVAGGTAFVPGGMPMNCFLPTGWLFDLIEWVEYSYSTSTTLRVPGKHILINNMAECESGEKRKSMLELAGSQYDGVGAANTFTAGGTVNDIVGMVNIPLPHSNMNSGKNIPFDASTVGTKPISIRIQFKQAIDFFTHPAVVEADVRAHIALMGNSVKEAYVTTKTGYLADGPSDSIAGQVSRGGGAKYDYAFLYPGWYQSEEFTGIAETEGNRVSLQLNGILPGSLQSMDIFVARESFDGGATPLTGSKRNGLTFEQLSNVEITYGGQCIYRSDDNLNQLLSIVEYPVTGAFDANYVRYNAASAAVAIDPRKANWLHVQLSQFNEQLMKLIQTGVSLNSNNVVITFNTPELNQLGVDQAAGAPATQPKMRLYANYNYQCSLRVADGDASILFMKPSRLLPSV